jgi:hypothetical protein
MKLHLPTLCAIAMLACSASAQQSQLQFPQRLQAGTAFSIPSSGSGTATLFIVGPGGVVRREIQLGDNIAFGPEDLPHAGHYTAIVAAGSFIQFSQFDVVPAQPAKLSFLAKPSRLPVNRPDGISGVAYVFDRFGNLALEPQPVAFALSDGSRQTQSRTATSHDGVAWVRMDSAAKAGPATFQASVGDVYEKRIVQQVAGEPCSIRITAHAAGNRVAVETSPIRDCSGNAVPDGTIVSFTETYQGSQSTVDVPIKREVARTELPAHQGAVISAASGVVLGNEIRWNGSL